MFNNSFLVSTLPTLLFIASFIYHIVILAIKSESNRTGRPASLTMTISTSTLAKICPNVLFSPVVSLSGADVMICDATRRALPSSLRRV